MRGGNLAVISSEAENDLIYALMGADRFRWWIGLSNVGHLVRDIIFGVGVCVGCFV